MKNSEQLLFPTTELCVDLKLMTREKRRMGVGEMKAGMLIHDAEEHYCFVENVKSMPRKRTPITHLYRGKAFNVLSNPKGHYKIALKQQSFMTAEQFEQHKVQMALELLSVSGYTIEHDCLVEEAEVNK